MAQQAKQAKRKPSEYEEINTLQEMALTEMGQRIVKFLRVLSEKENLNPPIEDHNILEHITRGLRSSKLLKRFRSASYAESFERFRKRWNVIEPLYPLQAESLKRNHSSKLPEGHYSATLPSLRLHVQTNKKEESEAAILWFRSLPKDQTMGIILDAYKEKR